MNATPLSIAAPALPTATGAQGGMGLTALRLTRSLVVWGKLATLLHTRTALAVDHYLERIRQVQLPPVAAAPPESHSAWDLCTGWGLYAVDFAQRSVIFWDTLRQRGNNFIEHERNGLPPVLRFEHEMVMDGRSLHRPVNYALLRIIPPAGVEVDPARRPYVIIDPRGGHGPGIGGFKDDSQVGVALRERHPVYFVVFFPNPEPGQTLPDVCDAEREFVKRVCELHPDAPKPAIVGNCQGGWAAMMLAASSPDATGPVVVVGAPMSYWGGAWSEGEGDNPMRYAGGLLGGSWLASLSSDLGAGKFDGAWLVQNFEILNPANTFWDKYYNLFAHADTEPPRFLEFERWWGGYYLLNREEIEWITQNLFIGNRLWSGAVKTDRGHALDLREIKVPIVLFASMGDNITPPQQAFNWVADAYGSTEEIKARGQVIVGLMHEDIGHLGIFVSGKVAKKEHAQIVSVLDSIEALPPGLYGMQIAERESAPGKPAYDVTLVELRLEEVVSRLNRFERDDEHVFETVKAVSEFNQRAYELFGRPLVQGVSNEFGAKLSRILHPMRLQRWAISDLNPWLSWLAPAAEAVRANRQVLAPEHPARQLEAKLSDLTSAALHGYRALRDTATEATFFHIYGQLHALTGNEPQRNVAAVQPVDPRELPIIKEALAAMSRGGYPEALARVAFLMAHEDQPLPLSRLQLAHELLEDYRDLLPDLPVDEVRRIAGRQDIIARYEPERAIETLPDLLRSREESERLLTLLERVLADQRVQAIRPTAAQTAMLARLRTVLESPQASARPRLASPGDSQGP